MPVIEYYRQGTDLIFDYWSNGYTNLAGSGTSNSMVCFSLRSEVEYRAKIFRETDISSARAFIVQLINLNEELLRYECHLGVTRMSGARHWYDDDKRKTVSD